MKKLDRFIFQKEGMTSKGEGLLMGRRFVYKGKTMRVLWEREV